MEGSIIRYFILGFVGFILIQVPGCSGLGKVKAKTFLYTCSIGGGSVLSNLSYVKWEINTDVYWTCNTLNTDPLGSRVITWYYYENYPQNCSSDTPDYPCCHSTANSTILITNSTFVNGVGTMTNIGTGYVSDGKFKDLNVTQTIVSSSADVTKCSTPIGLEARRGEVTLEITGGPTCNGELIQEYCPGLKN